MGKKKRRDAAVQLAADPCPAPRTLRIPARGVRTGVEQALRLPTVARCLDLLTDTCGQLDMVERVGGQDRPLPAWLAHPEAYRAGADARTLVTAAVWDMATDGAAYIYATAVGDESWILAPVAPDRVQVVWDDMHRRRWRMDGAEVPAVNGPAHRSGLLVVPKNLTNRVARPFGPLTHAPVAEWLEVEEYAHRVFSSGVHSGQSLNTDQDITPDTARRWQDDWMASHSDPGDRRIPVLGSGLKLESNIIDPAAAQWLESRTYNAQEQARLFGVPAYKLGLPGGDSLTYSTAIDADKQFLRTAVAGYLVPLAHALTTLLPVAADPADQRTIAFDEVGWLTIYDSATPADAPPPPPIPPAAAAAPQQQEALR